MLLILLVIVNFSCGIELTGSENTYHRDKHHTVEKHKPLPFIFHPLHFNGIGKMNTPVSPTKEIVTITKTIVIETTKGLHKQPVCVKAHARVPYCHSNTQIQASSVLQTPILESTKVIGVIEKRKEGWQTSQKERKVRHIILPHHFKRLPKVYLKEFHTVTETLRITRVEEYVDSSVTATLIAENCIPVNIDLPPCPVKVKDDDCKYNSGIEKIEHFLIFGKEGLERIDEDENVSDERTIFNSSLLFQL